MDRVGRYRRGEGRYREGWMESGGIGEGKWRYEEGWIESGRDRREEVEVWGRVDRVWEG